MRRSILSLVVLAVVGAGPLSARTTDQSPIPQATPLVRGTVVESNSHSVTVTTVEGEQLTFETDSRTVMPMTIEPGTRVRIEFHLMASGMRHAGRITPLQPGSEEWMMLDATPPPPPAEERQTGTYDDGRQTRNDTYTSSEQATTHEPMTDTRNEAATDHSGDASARNEGDLPQTASPQPLLLASAAIALGGALALRFLRRRRD